VIATSRAQKAPSQRGHSHWAKRITFGSGARARTRKFAVGMEDVVLKRDSQKRHSVSLEVGSGELCLLHQEPATPRRDGVQRDDRTLRHRLSPLETSRYIRCSAHVLACRIWDPSAYRVRLCGEQRKRELRRHPVAMFNEPDMFAVPMPSRGGGAWLQSSLYGNVEMPACLACRPRSEVLVRSRLTAVLPSWTECKVEEDQNNAASSHLRLHTLPGGRTSSALRPMMRPGDEFLVG